MSILTLGNECFSEILSFLNRKSLYKCLFVNKYYCNLSIPIIWREPFKPSSVTKPSYTSLTNTLVSCLNEDEISSLIPCAIILPKNQTPLFEYGKFIRKIDHEYFIETIVNWLRSSNEKVDDKYCKVQKLVHAIYHMIMRQGSNLQEIFLRDFEKADLPEFSIFIPGITNLNTFYLDLRLEDIMKYHNTFEFLNKISTFCNGIFNCRLYFQNVINDDDTSIKPFLDFIKLQPLKNMLIYTDNFTGKGNFKKIIYSLEFRSETLKKLKFSYMNFQDIDLSFISKLECLKSFVFKNCKGFTSQHCDSFSKKKFDLKKLKLLDCKGDSNLVIEKIISSLVGKSLCKLTLCIFTLEIFKAVKESSPNISFLHVDMDLKDLILVIPQICDLTSLKILHLESIFDGTYGSPVAEALGDHLTSVEYLYLQFYIDLPSFRYFTNNCKANLKKWLIMNVKCISGVTHYLDCVNSYQNVHKSLKILGVTQGYYGCGWSNSESMFIKSLNNKGVDVVTEYELSYLFYA